MLRKSLIGCLIALLALVAWPGLAQDDGSPSRVCMVLNIGTVNDGTFNQVAYEGLLDIRRDYDLSEADTIFLESQGPEDWGPNIQQCIDEGYDVVVTVGFQLAEQTTQFALDHPDVYFIGIDHFVADGPENYVGIQFRDDEAGFLMGYLAGLVTESNVVAGIYGPEIPVIMRFRNGFENGAALASQETGTPLTVLGEYLAGFDNPEAGAEAAEDFIEQGADVIFGAAGLTGSGGIQYAAQQGVYVIGVDQNEYFTTFEGGEAEGSEFIISSALKRVNVGVYDMVSTLLDGNFAAFPGGSNYILSLENGGISFANPQEADVPDEVFDRVVEIGGELAFGDLSTGVNPETGMLADAPTETTDETADPTSVVETYLTATFVDFNVDLVSTLTCAQLADDMVLDETFIAEAQSLNIRIEGIACTFDDASQTVSCAGEFVATVDGQEARQPLGTYSVVQEADEWKYCGEVGQ